ncbi:hypothetical protein LEN26_000998 [Aphanomyces euteiches]|uniref:AB hydrolase-1 domain-containing protein n=1 Tax=Aphanomyces euteiches TaxID=100861 RepID=A0A6G0WLM9_9STRA|nr:hypothetical protein Ae201684_013888 [Aphanomyces euteiches]KAH9125992.1 hypothetical protein AeMF1_003487 [Aphanomyces euteiches]KAH9156539.1 hypothetical protein AeRB84_001571 [Aphanomyces euteiches]KAH9162286.1 hypothetical protein LEN26_000998 [Aphanomyces euteiches]KAH9190946.1 hypothetical protein AeNC1_007075 [Aphanomyces euteiches]
MLSRMLHAVEVESQWCILPSWIRAALVYRALHDRHLPAIARAYVYLAFQAHVHVHRHLSTHPYPPKKHVSHPKYFSLLLEAPYHPSMPPPRRIVLLHGWLMTHKDWKQTALKLHRKYGYSVLLIDFIGHGYSSYMPSYDHHLPALLVHQVRDAIVRANWANDPSVKITFAGISLGCAVSLRYAQLFPANVDKIIMLCGAGMATNRWYVVTPLIRPFNKAILDAMEWLQKQSPSLLYWLNNLHFVKNGLSHIHLTQFTPEHQVDQAKLTDVLDRFATAAVWPHVDFLHPLQLELFEKSPPTRVIKVPACEHGIFCLLVDFLELDKERSIWEG